MLSSFASSAASEPNYRLAGIVATAGEGALALIELPDGRQRLFHTGDVLGNGTIRAIATSTVRVDLGQEDLLLRLRGKPLLVASVLAEAASAGHENEPTSADDETTPDSAEDGSEVASDGDRGSDLDSGGDSDSGSDSDSE